MYLTIKSELASKRQGTSSSKNRSDVRGGGAKPWKQKGTGRARVGSTRNPSRVHGGAAFGPQPHKYNLKVNKKTKLLARKSALSYKVSSNNFIVIDNFDMNSNKTKDFLKILSSLKISDKKIILINNAETKNLYLSSRNLENVNTINVTSFSVVDVVNGDFLLIDKTSIEYLNENLN